MGIVGRRGPNGKKRPSRAVSVGREPLQTLDERPKLHRATMDDEIKTQGEHGQSPGERDKPPGSHIDLPETRTATAPWWGVLAIPGLPLGSGRAESSSELS